MKIELEIDLDKFRWSLVGDGYLYEEVRELSQEALKNLLQDRLNWTIKKEYNKSVKLIKELGLGYEAEL